MYPVLLAFGNFTIYTYGFFVALAFMVAVFYLLYSIKKSEEKIISQDNLYSLVVNIIIIGVIGGRLFFVLTNFKYYVLNPLDIFKMWQGGLVYYGGLINVLIFICIYAKIKKINLLRLSDFFAPGLALGHAIGRIGCFFAGCCHGKASNLPWAITFTNERSLAVKGIPLHPTQLYESLANFLLFILLHFYCKKKNKAVHGMSSAIYLIGYAVLRFIIEFFRGDADRGASYLGFSVSQVISVFLFIAGVAFIIWKKKLYIKNLKGKD
jgi:phosphatidylglycerol:prolipoprotein diacylglycerol transferase